MNANLTLVQGEVVAAIRALTAELGFPPTNRELAARLGTASSAVHGVLVRLRAAGIVTWEDGRARTLRVVDGKQRRE